MDPNDPATVTAIVGIFATAVIGAYGACFGVVALVDFFKSVAR